MCGADLSDLEEEKTGDRKDNPDKKSGVDKGKEKP